MKQKILQYFTLTIVILLSFRLFSSVFYPLFNSDDGVTVLMLHYFKFPHDIYFWNQDRVGSIIPLFGQIFYKWLGFSSLWSESITHYIILILGYLSFASLLKKPFYKLVFAIIWFFPILHFIGLVRYTFGLQYSLVGMLIYCINKYSNFRNPTFIKKILTLILMFILSVLAVWVSDSAIVTLFIMYSVLGYFIYQHSNKKLKSLYTIETLFIFLASIAGLLIISYIKSIADINDNYNYNKQLINSSNEIWKSVLIAKNSLYNILSFNIPDFLISIYSYCIIVLTLMLFTVKTKFITIPENSKKWIYFFLLDASILLIIVLISHWAFLNNLARRYFTGAYITYWLAFLIYVSNFPKSYKKTVIDIFIIVTIFVGGISAIYSYKYVYPKRLTPKADIVKEFEQLGKIGIISEFWNSYGTSFVNPNLIIATPNDKSEVRNYDLVDSVFNQPKLFIIKDMWLDSFPPQMNQFGYTLNKKGKEFIIGDCTVCEYKKEKIKSFFLPLEFRTFEELISPDSILIVKNTPKYINKHVIYGPYINLPQGKYKVIFKLKILSHNNDADFAIIDVTTNGGQKTLAGRTINQSDFDKSQNLKLFNLNFETKKSLSDVEFRIYNLGGEDFCFYSVEIQKK